MKKIFLLGTALLTAGGLLLGTPASAQQAGNGSPSVPLFEEIEATLEGIREGVRDFFVLLVLPNWRYILAAAVLYLVARYLNGRVLRPTRRRR